MDKNNHFKWNEEMVQRYDPEVYHLGSHPLIRWIERRRVNTIIQLLEPKTEDKILEVGCGAGNIIEKIPLGELFGIDLSTYILKKAKKRLGKKAKIIQCSGDKLPFVDHYFDKVYCSEVLEHVPEPRAFLMEMTRVIKKEGMIIISVPNEILINKIKDVIFRVPLLYRLLQSFGNYRTPARMTDEWHIHEFDIALLKRTTSGLIKVSIVKRIPFDFLPVRYVILGTVNMQY